jgi:hypothetical protein
MQNQGDGERSTQASKKPVLLVMIKPESGMHLCASDHPNIPLSSDGV